MKERTFYYSSKDMSLQGASKGFLHMKNGEFMVHDAYATYVSDIVDSGEAHMLWDELHLDIDASNTKIYVWIFDEEEQANLLSNFTYEDRFYAIVQQGFPTDCKDVLLYGRKEDLYGRYLCFAVEMNEAIPDVIAFKGYEISFPKYCFSEYLPSVYQNNPDLEAYLAVFKDMYLDIEKRIDTFEDELNIYKMKDDHVDDVLSWFGFHHLKPYLKNIDKRVFFSAYEKFKPYSGTIFYYEQMLSILFQWNVVIKEKDGILCIYGDEVSVEKELQIHEYLKYELPFYCPYEIVKTSAILLDTTCFLSYNTKMMEKQKYKLPLYLYQGIRL